MSLKHLPLGERIRRHLQSFAKISIIFLSIFAAITLFEVQSYHSTTSKVSEGLPKISNVHTSINPNNLNRYQNHTLIFYNSNCKACQEIIPKYYSADRLVNLLTLHRQPIYLDINYGNNRTLFTQLGIASTPKKGKITNIDYDRDTGQITNLSQEQSEISTPRMLFNLIFINIFWSALVALIYVLLLDGSYHLLRYSQRLRHK